MAYNNTIDVRWQELRYRPFTINDIIIPGLDFSQELTDPRLEYYEVERQFIDDDEDDWVSLGSFMSTFCTISAAFERAVKVRIRAVLRDGTRTAWAYSGWFSLYGMTADFSEVNNALFLGFI